MNPLFKSFDPVKFYDLNKRYFDETYDLEYYNLEPLVLKRGNYEYYTPYRGWKRYAFNTIQYGNRNEWISCDGKNGEWAVAYHGLRRDVRYALKGIGMNGFKVYTSKNSQWGSESDDIGDNCNLFKNKKCGVGIFCTPQLKYLNIEQNIENVQLIKPLPYNKDYYVQTVLQCRVRPAAIRIPKCSQGQYYIINSPNDIRPYGILVNFIKSEDALKILNQKYFDFETLNS